MPETIDVTKMKVADLKRELKVRGLAITGNKTELADRLQAALIDGELLDDAAISGEDLLEDEDAVLTDEDEAKILDENELLQSPGASKSNAGDLSAVLPVLSASSEPTSTPTISKKIVLKRKTSLTAITTVGELASATTPSTEISLAKENTAPTPPKLVKLLRDTAGEPGTASEASENAAIAVKKVSQLTLQERLDLRAKKFGINATQTKATATDVGNANVANDTNTDKETELLKKRKERFGCVVSSKMVQLDAAERLQKRKERFGGIASTTAKIHNDTAVGPNVESDVWAEKARLRLERFKSNAVNNVATDAAATTVSAVTCD